MSEWATVLGDKEWYIFFFLKIFSKFVVVSVSAVCVWVAVLTVGSNHTLSTSLGGGRDREGKKLRKKKMFLVD